MNMMPEYRARINRMDRAQIVQALENVCIACYDSESTEVLREALLENVLDGTVDLNTLPE